MYLVNNINGVAPYECYIQLRSTNECARTVWLTSVKRVYITNTMFNFKYRMSAYPVIPIGYSVTNN